MLPGENLVTSLQGIKSVQRVAKCLHGFPLPITNDETMQVKRLAGGPLMKVFDVLYAEGKPAITDEQDVGLFPVLLLLFIQGPVQYRANVCAPLKGLR